MKTTLNQKEINFIKEGHKIQAMKSYRERMNVSLREAHTICLAAEQAFKYGEELNIDYNQNPNNLTPCHCGGNAKLTERRTSSAMYAQVRCNKCGRRGGVFSYWDARHDINLSHEMLENERAEAKADAIHDWESMVSI